MGFTPPGRYKKSPNFGQGLKFLKEIGKSRVSALFLKLVFFLACCAMMGPVQGCVKLVVKRVLQVPARAQMINYRGLNYRVINSPYKFTWFLKMVARMFMNA